jgi:CRP/FNR family cyclic AMP-dependent transcriptional regulator
MRKALFFLGILHDEDVDWLLANGRREPIAAGTVLIREGQPITAVYIVLEGVFRVAVGTPPSQEVARLSAGEVVGEMSFVDSHPPSATVQAVTDGVVLALARPLLDARLTQNPAFAGRFYRSLAVFLADRLRHTTRRLGYGPVEVLQETTEYADELDGALVANLTLAGARFDWMLQRLRGQQAQEESQ